MEQVNADTWASHCARWPTYSREYIFSGSSTLMETFISHSPPRPGQESGKVGAMVGRVEYLPNGEKRYFIF